MTPTHFFIPDEEQLARPALEQLQRRKLKSMLTEILPKNRFYAAKLEGIDFNPLTDPMDRLPFTTRQELEQDQLDHPAYGSNLTYPITRYARLHQTSGSAGKPLKWLDTVENWEWWKRLWGIIFAAAEIGPADRLVFPFSFGPFVGFWGAFEAAAALGRFVLAAGGMSTTQRLKFILENEATVVCCTPTYALRMAEVAEQEGIDLRRSSVRAVLVAGEPGGHIPATRSRIEAAWGARLFDHTGMTEIGPLGFECVHDPGSVHLVECDCIAEVVDPTTGRAVPAGEAGELIITNLGRIGSPVIRYRTGDQVRLTQSKCACGRWFARMEAGIIGRIDDMVSIKGNNVFPTAIEGVIRTFGQVAEFALEVHSNGALPRMVIKVEPAPGVADPQQLARQVARALEDTIALKAELIAVPAGTLPRFEMKARRFTRCISSTI